MSLLDPFLPHVQRAAQVHEHYMGRIAVAVEETRRELRQQGDQGRPDTGDNYEHNIVRAALPAESRILEGPSQGEIWMLQYFASNGKGAKTPAFVIRTTTGRLIVAAEAEQNFNQSFSGNVVIMPGEELVIESAAGGNFDLILETVLRKFPRQAPDAGWGVSEEVYEDRYRGEHEVERDALPALGMGQPHAPADAGQY